MRVEFFIADDIQSLEGGKIMTLGLYPDRVLLISIPPEAPKDTPLLLPKLSILASIIDGAPGSYEVTPELTPPAGGLSPTNVPTKTITIETGRSISAIFNFMPFVVSKLGTYIFKVSIGGKFFETTIEFREKKAN